MTTIEELDQRLAQARAETRRLRAETIAEWEQKLAAETNPYEREHLERELARFRAMATDA